MDNGGVRRGGSVALVGPVAVAVANGGGKDNNNVAVGGDGAAQGGNDAAKPTILPKKITT